MTPFTCPVCNGKLKLPAGFYLELQSGEIEGQPQACRTCNKKGIIWDGLSNEKLNPMQLSMLHPRERMMYLRSQGNM
jgi:hypothetical protein